MTPRFFSFSSSPKLAGLHLCEDYDEEDYQYLLRRGNLFDVALIWRIFKRRELTDEERYTVYIHFKIIACGICLRNRPLTLPTIRLPRIYDQEPITYFDVDTTLTNYFMLESELFYKILLEDHRV